ncbi:MAG: alpha/beta hydrolase [Tardiphaga sp.]|nr:alpha/beta hydrolase [Tardiphaga sp.]
MFVPNSLKCLVANGPREFSSGGLICGLKPQLVRSPLRNEACCGRFDLHCNICRVADISCSHPGVSMTPMNRLSRLPTSVSRNRNVAAGPSYAVAAVVAAGALAAAALLNRHLAKKAEHDNPPAGQFLDVDGVRLHYVERGSGEPLVLLHGNGSMIQDFESSGLVDLAAKNYRVIIIDRPGFGHSSRPRNVIWTPDAQAQLIERALTRLGVSQAIVLGHSWGASVAAALALKFPNFVRGLVLASGYYYPTLRPDVVAMSAPAFPVVGDIMGHTVSPMISRLMWPLMMAKIFGPKSAPSKFERFPKEMALRPSQIRSSAAESALMIPDAFHFHDNYGELKMPVVIIAGEDDRLIDIDKQSARLHSDICQSAFHRVAQNGHMIHQTATDQVMAAINKVAGKSP